MRPRTEYWTGPLAWTCPSAAAGTGPINCYRPSTSPGDMVHANPIAQPTEDDGTRGRVLGVPSGPQNLGIWKGRRRGNQVRAMRRTNPRPAVVVPACLPRLPSCPLPLAPPQRMARTREGGMQQVDWLSPAASQVPHRVSLQSQYSAALLDSHPMGVYFGYLGAEGRRGHQHYGYGAVARDFTCKWAQ